MAKKGAPTLFNPKPSRPTLPNKKPPATNIPSPGSSQSATQSAPNGHQSQSQSAPGTPRKPPRATISPALFRRPAPKTDDDTTPTAPEGSFTEYRLMSSKLNGWLYDVLKFDSRRPVEIRNWATPVKLNRKDPHRNDAGDQQQQQAVGQMVGSDGKLVVGQDGKVVMVDALGRPIRNENADKDEKGKGKDKDGKKKRFQKKTRQVFLVPEETRQLRREEKFPWVMEDGMQKEKWVGRMEEVAKSQTHAMFMPAANDVFMFVPAHRWYKFQKKPSHHIPNLEEAESLMNKMQKRNEVWALRQKAEQAVASGSSLVHSTSQSLGPGGRMLRTVDSGPGGLFGDDDEEGIDSKRKVKRELGAEGFLDELDFEDTFADDEDKMEPDDKEDDEEAKELEERLKREYKAANKTREGYIDESDEEEDDTQLTGAGKNLQKTLKKLEKGGAYDESDDEKNPYASSEEEEEEEEPQVHTGPAILAPEPKPGAQPNTQPLSGVPLGKPAGTNGQAAVKSEPQSPSRATSPVPGHGGHSVVAKRATSPKMPKPKTGIPSRAGSPLASTNGASAPASRAASPGISAVSGPRADSPATGKALKRKATDDTAAAPTDGAPRQKKRKAPGELEDRMVIEWLRNTPNAMTRDCISHFKRYLTDEGKKSKFTALVKEVAQLSNGILVLRPAYRGTGTPAPVAG